MQIILDEQQRQILLRIVEQYYSNLRQEIVKTDGSAFKDSLKEEEQQIENLLEKLGAGGIRHRESEPSR